MLARQAGQVAHSPELTAAVGLLASALVLSACGENLARTLSSSLQGALLSAEPLPVAIDAAEVVTRIRHLALGVVWPLGLTLGAFALAAIGTHQAQAGGLWAPALLAPDPARLWLPARGEGMGLASHAARGFWSIVKAVVVVAATGYVLRADWPRIEQLGGADVPTLARAAAVAMRHLLLTLAATTLLLGLIDFTLRYLRFEAMLRTTPEQSREDMRSTEGDPALRARRRQLTRVWRQDPAEVLAGASLVLTGHVGLTIVLCGGPPPRGISVRSTASGAQGDRLRRAAQEMKIANVEAPALARRLAQRRPPGLPLPPDVLITLAPLWLSSRAKR
jgi:flagellar biosynthetic protein FlhB